MIGIGVLGPVVLFGPNGEHQLASRQMRALLAHLVAEPSGLTADELIDRVWGHDAPDSALSSMRAQLSRLRRTLTDVVDDGPSIDFEASKYRLVTAGAETDLAVFRRRCARFDEIRPLRQALDLWRGRAFGLFGDDEPLMPVAAALEHERVIAEEALAGLLLDTGAHGEVITWALDATQRNPFREAGWSALARAHYGLGDAAAALASLTTMRERFANELGLDPSPDVAALELSILRHDEVLTGIAAPVRAVSRPLPDDPDHPPTTSHHQPRPSALRSDELIRIVDHVSAGDDVAITIVGPAGSGKTHLLNDVMAALPTVAGDRPIVRVQCTIDDVGAGLDVWRVVCDELGATEWPADTADATDFTCDSLARAGDPIIVIDDFHAADAASVALAHEVERRQLASLVIAQRPIDGDVGDDTTEGTNTIDLPPLDHAQVLRLITETVDQVPPWSIVNEIEERSGGTALLVVRYAEAWRNGIPPAAADLGTLERRLFGAPSGHQDAEVAQIACVLAVAGGSLPVATLHQVANLPTERLWSCLDRGVADGDLVINERSDAMLPHQRAIAAILADLPFGRRSQLHAAMADAYERTGLAHTEPLRHAHHLVEALPAGTPDDALESARRALVRAVEQRDPTGITRAARLVLRAETFCEMDPLQRAEVWSTAGRQLVSAGAVAEGREVLEHAADVFETVDTDDHQSLGSALEALVASIEIGVTRYRIPEPKLDRLRRLRDAYQAMTDADDATLVKVDSLLASAADHFDPSLTERAMTLGDPSAVLLAVHSRNFPRLRLQEPAERRRDAEMIDAAASTEPAARVLAAVHRLEASIATADVAHSDHLDRLESIVASLGMPSMRWWPRSARAAQLVLAGQVAHGRALAVEAESAGVEEQGLGAMVHRRALDAVAGAITGDSALAVETMAWFPVGSMDAFPSPDQLLPVTTHIIAGRILSQATAGLIDEAAAAIEAFMPTIESIGARSHWSPSWAWLAEACLFTGQVAPARVLAGLLDSAGDRAAVLAGNIGYGLCQSLAGLAWLAGDEPRMALERLRPGADREAALGWHLPAWRSRCWAAVAWRRLGEPNRVSAAELRHQALQLEAGGYFEWMAER